MGNVEELVGQLLDALGTSEAPVRAAGVVVDGERGTRLEPAEAPEGRFEVGSVTKTMTGLVLARLTLDGVVSLDDPVRTWLDVGDDGSDGRGEDGTGDITLVELATHTSGLPRMAPNAWTHPGFDEVDPYAAYTAELAEEGLQAATRTDQGTYAYSNFGFQLLGICLERAAGEPLAQLLRRHVLDPAGMTGAVVHPDAGVMAGHGDDGTPAHSWTVSLAGPGGVNLGIDDLTAYAAAVATGADGPLGPPLAMALEPRAEGPGAQIGLGWILHPAGIACHGGGTAGFSSYCAVHLETGRGIALLANRHSSEVVEVAALAAAAGRNPTEVVPTPYDGDPARWVARSTEFFEHFVTGDFDAARALMHPKTAESLTVERIQAAWSSVAVRTGPLEAPSVAGVERVGATVRTTVTAAGERDTVTMRVSYLDDGQVAGVLLS